MRVDAEVDLAGWEEELSKVTPLSIFAEDGSYAQYRNILEESDFPFGSILETIAPILEKKFVDSVNELRLDDAFAIHYSEQHRDTTVNLHTDPSDITVNLCLGRSADLEGSSTAASLEGYSLVGVCFSTQACALCLCKAPRSCINLLFLGL